MITTPTARETRPVRVTTLRTTAARWLLVVSLLLGGGLCALLLKAGRRVDGASAAPARQLLPALQGQPAVDYLKEHGLYDRLHESIEASQYQLNRLPRSRPGKGAAYRANNPAQRLQASFSGEEMLLEPVQRRGRPHWRMGLKLRGVGYGARLNAVTAGLLRASGNRVEYDHALLQSAIKEWYVNTTAGIEQGFTLSERPGVTFGGEPLRVALAVTGELTASLENEGQTVVLARRDGLPVLRYDHLAAYDALGRALPARMEVRGDEIALVVDDAAAVYPLTIDPLFTQIKKLTASDAEGNDFFGEAVGISGDTVVVGAFVKNSAAGAAYIYERNQGGADNWGEVKILTASDGAANDEFGHAVGISGDTVVVGAYAKNVGRGAAYVFARNQGGADNWGQVKKLTASDAVGNDFFGWSVGISGDTVVAGAYQKNSTTGAAYLYGRNQGGADNWGEIRKLTASDGEGGDVFGIAVGISGDTVVVGASNRDSSGAAYLFGRNQGGADNWGEVRILTASAGATNDEFGIAVGISGDTVVVGAPGVTVTTQRPAGEGPPPGNGAAYVFARNQGGAGNWGQVKQLLASDGASGDRFGEVVGISNDTIVVGARDKNSRTGAAYLYERNQGGADNWGQAQKLTASDAAANDRFGISVGISADTVVAGASRKNSNTGAAYAFTNQCGTWTQTKKATASDGMSGDSLGNYNAVGISGDTIVAGASFSTNGTAYIFARNQGGADNWGEVKILTASDAVADDEFGASVGIAGDTVVVGARDKNTSTGAAYIFERNQGGAGNWGQVKKLTASDAATNDAFGASVGISGEAVVVGAQLKNSFRGAAYVFARNQGGADNWGEVKKLTASDAAANDRFGSTIGISNDTVVVGAVGKNSVRGAAYLYGRNQGGADNWGEVKKLTASDAAAGDQFGLAVGIDTDTVVVGAGNKNAFTGAAYLYERNQGGADNWGQVKKLTASDAAANDLFGISVGISADKVVVGAVGKNAFAGAGYVFGRNQGGADNWGQVQILTASDAEADDLLGDSIGISGDTIVAGADGRDAGAVYLFATPCPVFSTPVISKDFSPALISVGGTSTITLTLTNPNASPLTNAAFTDTLTNMSAVGGVVGGTCSGTTPSNLTAGATALSFSGISIPASGSCTVSFAVTSNTPGVQPNQTSGVTTAQTAAGDPSNTANLTVACPTITVSPATVPDGRIHLPYPATNFSASSGVSRPNQPSGCRGSGCAPFTFMLTGTLPAGLNFNNGVLSGTPTQAGNFSFTVTATETATGCTGSRSYTLVIKRSTVKADFDGDGKTDLSVWRGNLFPAPWLIRSSFDNSLQSIDWGTGQAPQNDEIVPGDYDGDGKTDVGVFRRENGHWYIQRSSDGAVIDQFWGLGTDVPVPGDYDGDGSTDIAVWRASANSWYIINSSDGSIRSEVWGTVGDTPVPGDYDGDGKTDIAVWRGAVGGWYILQSSDGMIKSETWGTSDAPHFDVPVPADYDGDGKYDIAVWRGAMTNWYVLKSSDGQTQSISWGTSAAPYNDVPVPGDYDGDGKADAAVWRPLDGNWLVIRSSNGTNLIQQHGQSGDTPAPSKGGR